MADTPQNQDASSKGAETQSECQKRNAEDQERGEINKSFEDHNAQVKAYKNEQKVSGKSKATGAGADAFGKGGLASAKDLLGDLAHNTLTKDADKNSATPQRQAELLAEIKRDGYILGKSAKAQKLNATNTDEAKRETRTENFQVSLDVKAELLKASQGKIEKSTETLRLGAERRFGREAIAKLNIGKDDVGAAISVLLLGPDICKAIGPEQTSLLGKQLVVFGIAPMYGMADEAHKQFSEENLQQTVHDGSGNFLAGTAIGAVLERAHPAILTTALVGGSVGLINDQLNAPEHQERNSQLADISKRLAGCSNSDLIQFADRTKTVLGPAYYKASFDLLTGGAGLPEGNAIGSAAKEEAGALAAKVDIKKVIENLDNIGRDCWNSLASLIRGNNQGLRLAHEGVPGDEYFHAMSADRKENFEDIVLRMLGKAGEYKYLPLDGNAIKKVEDGLLEIGKKPLSENLDELGKLNQELLNLQDRHIVSAAQGDALARVQEGFLSHVKALENDTAKLKSEVDLIEKKPESQWTKEEQEKLQRFWDNEEAIYAIINDSLKSKFGWDGRTSGSLDRSVSVKTGFDAQKGVNNQISQILNSGLESNPVIQEIFKKLGVSPERSRGWIGIPTEGAADKAGCDYLLVNRNTGEMHPIDVTERTLSASTRAGRIYDSPLTNTRLELFGKDVPKERMNTVIGISDNATYAAVERSQRELHGSHRIDEQLRKLELEQLSEIIGQTICRPSDLHVLYSQLPSGKDLPASRMAYELWRFRISLEKIGHTDWAQAIGKSIDSLRKIDRGIPHEWSREGN